MLDWSLYHYVVNLYVFYYTVYFKVYFVWYEYCNNQLPFHFYLHKIFFHSFMFSLCVSLDSKWVLDNIQMYLVFYPFNHSMYFIEEFSSFIFKVGIYRYILIAILLIVLWLFLLFLCVPFFPCGLMPFICVFTLWLSFCFMVSWGSYISPYVCNNLF